MIQLNHCGLAATTLAHGAATILTGFLLLASRLWLRHPGWTGILRLTHITLGVLTGFYGAAAYLTAPR